MHQSDAKTQQLCLSCSISLSFFVHMKCSVFVYFEDVYFYVKFHCLHNDIENILRQFVRAAMQEL